MKSNLQTWFIEGKEERLTGFHCILCVNSINIKDNCFVYDVKFLGVNFPPNGPVMQKKTLGWEPSTERLYVRDGFVNGDNLMALKLQEGGHFTCDFKTIYKYVLNTVILVHGWNKMPSK